MPIKVRLVEERQLEINVDPSEWRKAFERALESNLMIEIRNADGEVLGINPQQVLYWVEVPETESQLVLEDQEVAAT
jgi:hypothetical protein